MRCWYGDGQREHSKGLHSHFSGLKEAGDFPEFIWKRVLRAKKLKLFEVILENCLFKGRKHCK